MVSFAANVRRRGWTLREIGLDRRKGIAHGWLKFVEGGVLSLVLTLRTCRDIVIRTTDTEIASCGTNAESANSFAARLLLVSSRLSQLVKLNKWRDATMDGWNAMADLIARVYVYIYIRGRKWNVSKRFRGLSALSFQSTAVLYSAFVSRIIFFYYPSQLSPCGSYRYLALLQTSLSLSLSRFLIRKGSGYVKRKDVALVGILLEIPRGSYLSDLSDAFSSSYHLFIFLWDGKLW